VEYNYYPTFFSFRSQPPDFVLAEYVSWNMDLVRNNFGVSVGLDRPNTPLYKSQVQALHSVYWKGPTVSAIRLGVQALLGLPFAEHAGEVTAIDTAYTGGLGQITVRESTGNKYYTYPRVVTPVVAVGDTVVQFQVLTTGVAIVDWKNDPDWFRPFLDDLWTPSTSPFAVSFNMLGDIATPRNEVQKYHMYMVEIDEPLFMYADLSYLLAFLNSIRTTWKSVLLSIVSRLLDVLDPVETVTLDGVIHLRDYGGDALSVIRYGDGHLYGDPIVYGQYHLIWPVDEITVTETNTDVVPHNTIINGFPVVVNAGDSVTETF
jgi:hypothetical protein